MDLWNPFSGVIKFNQKIVSDWQTALSRLSKDVMQRNGIKVHVWSRIFIS